MKREKGITLIELIFTILIFIFVLISIAKGIIDYQKFQKRAHIFNTGRILLENLRGTIETRPFNFFDNITNYYQTSATCALNGTCSFDTEECYTNTKYNTANCLPEFYCIYCLQNNQLVPSAENCSFGYQYNVGFNVSRIVDIENPYVLLGYGICIVVWFNDPIYNSTKNYRSTVIVRNWL